MGTSTRMALITGWIVVATALASGCGAAAEGDSSAGSEGPAVEVTPAGTSLTVVYTPEEGAAAQTWTLTCDPAGGTHPDAAAACAALDADGVAALAPPPADQICTMIYGGPQRATVRGTVAGTSVEASIDRGDGCGIARWKTLTGLLPEIAR